MYAYSVLHAASSITGAVWAKIEAAGRHKLVVAKTRSLEVYSVDDELTKLYAVEMGSAILGITADESRVPSRIITLLEDGSVYSWQWKNVGDKLTHTGTCVVKAFLKYEGQSMVTRGNTTVISATNGGPQLWITPKGNNALKVSLGYGGVGLSVSNAFVADGILAILYRDSLNNVGMAYVNEKMKGTTEIGCASGSDFSIGDSASLLVSVTLPCHGVLVISDISVLYYPPFSKKVSGTYKIPDDQLLRADFPRSLIISAASKMQNGVVVLSSDVGDVAVVTLSDDGSSLDVVLVEKPAESALQFPPTSLVRMDDGLFFAASHHDNSVVFKLDNVDKSSSRNKRRKVWSYSELSIVSNIAPINDITLTPGPLQQLIVYAACGGYTSGSVSKLYHCVDPFVEEEIPLGDGADQVWWFDNDMALFVKYMTHCAVLRLENGSLIELDGDAVMNEYGFVLEESLWLGQFNGKDVQVTSSGIRAKGVTLEVPITSASFSNGALMVASEKNLYTLESLAELPEPVSLTSSPWSYATNGDKVYVSYLNGGTFELKSSEKIFSEPASSIVVVNGYTVLGFPDGQVRILEANFVRRLGIAPVKLLPLWDDLIVVYSSDGLGVIDVTTVNDSCMIPFIEGTIPISVSAMESRKRISYIVSGDMYVAELPAPSFGIVSEQFNALVRRICLVDDKVVVAMAERDIDESGAESVSYRVALLSHQLKVLDMFDLKPFESLESLISYGSRVYVGTGIDDKDSPTEGRVLVFSISGDKLKVESEKQIPGCAYSLSVVQRENSKGKGKPHIVVGCNAVLDDCNLDDLKLLNQTKTPTLAFKSSSLGDDIVVGDLIYGYSVYKLANKLEPVEIKSSEPMFTSAVELLSGPRAVYSRSDGTVGINDGEQVIEQKFPDKMMNAIKRVPEDTFVAHGGKGLAVCAGVEGGLYLISEIEEDDEDYTLDAHGETPAIGEGGFYHKF
ncbi:hypothetical protein CJU90_2426 [Yarrowia sp. C11]|nr:hypothetical protein CKK34_6453 [Yarrowia sp. E02]KAG5372340.1 hypothetical protein CJU90_2426 [Yarrowia sp. C11]